MKARTKAVHKNVKLGLKVKKTGHTTFHEKFALS